MEMKSSAPQSQEATGNVPTTPERFRQIRAIFEAAIERPVSERERYVDRVCAGDGTLNREVRAMLRADEASAPWHSGQEAGTRENPASAPDEGRFPAGTVLAGRYRVLGLLGRGGMGEVYRTFDVILNQTVALKFISAGGLSERALVRFRNEARIARQVSHPNVCRVYDLGKVDGLYFLSMEYIDGENLASLLRRIGRIPQDTAVEFTRKICAGLGAAHERGVLHRDLKPSNIMIDGQGHVKITDFGLAGFAEEIPLSDVGSGTPAYMSPEQKAGKEISVRSDIYALGLVLHEMFTGRRWEGGDSGPGDPVVDLDPAIHSLILRCLAPKPDERPRSALGVAMALPGADPVAAALAAGETPSPETVAASHEREGFRPRTAVLCFAIVLVCFLAGTALSSRMSLLAQVPLSIPPDVLAYQAGELISRLGYANPPADTAYGFERLDQVAPVDGPTAQSILAGGRPAVFRFWYRQHDEPLRGLSVGYGSPANSEPGMKRMLLDPKGRLMELEVQPREASGADERDWMPVLFEAAGLDADRFNPVEPEFIPPMAADTRSAWVGTPDSGASGEVRVKAAFWSGRPVFLSISEETSPEAAAAFSLEELPRLPIVLLAFLIPPAIVISGLSLAWLNVRHGRADRRGAATVAGVTFLAFMGQYVVAGRHPLGLGELNFILAAVFNALPRAGLVYALYLAVEPYARRHWPNSLISWKRVLSGRFRDPLVASHVLAGVVVVLAAYGLAAPLVALLLGAWAQIPLMLEELAGAAFPVWVVFRALGYTMLNGLILMTLTVLLRLVVGRVWVADGLVAVVFGIMRVAAPATIMGDAFDVAAGWVYFGLLGALLVWTMRRFGLLAMAAGLFVFHLQVIHFVSEAWFAGRVLVTLAIPVVLAGWTLWAILSERRRPVEALS